MSDGAETLVPLTIPLFFVTTPALASYRDTAGNCATIAGVDGSCATEFAYSPDLRVDHLGPDALGTESNPFPVSAEGGKIKLTLSYWRPQRKPISPALDGTGGDSCVNDEQPCSWIDVGGLAYDIGGEGQFCTEEAFSTDDDDLTVGLGSIGGGQGRVIDHVPDQAADPQNTMTFVLDLTECLSGSLNQKWPVGATRDFYFSSVETDRIGTAGQGVWFRRVPPPQ